VASSRSCGSNPTTWTQEPAPTPWSVTCWSTGGAAASYPSPAPRRHLLRRLRREVAYQRGALLPDGTSPVFTEEADRIKSHGRAAEAVIAAIDFLKPLPGTVPSGASVANVALDVDAAGGGTYRVLARFGFRTAERRRQIGHVGAHVPVRTDRSDPARVTLDSARLPPL
jgi:hypothetical protein